MAKLLKHLLRLFTVTALTTAVVFSVGSQSMNDDYLSDINALRSEFVEEFPDDEELIDAAIQAVLNDPQFFELYSQNNGTALSALESNLICAIAQRYDFSPYASDGAGRFWSSHNMGVVNQIQNNFCGPACAIMALRGCGLRPTSNVYTVAQSMGISAGGNGVTPQTIVNYLNGEIGSTKYNYSIFTQYNYTYAISYMTYAFANGIIPIVQIADTQYLGYYNNVSYSHYVVVQSINYQLETIEIIDPHYLSAYRGVHIITFDEFENAMKHTNLYGTTNSYIISHVSGNTYLPLT